MPSPAPGGSYRASRRTAAACPSAATSTCARATCSTPTGGGATHTPRRLHVAASHTTTRSYALEPPAASPPPARLFAGRRAGRVEARRRACDAFVAFASEVARERPVDWVFVYAMGIELLPSALARVRE